MELLNWIVKPFQMVSTSCTADGADTRGVCNIV